MTDIAETIARLKRYAEVHRAQDVVTIPQTDLAKVLDAAEAGMRSAQPATREAVQRVKDMGDERAARARDAALEEAAFVAEHACLVDPDGGSPTDAEAELCAEAARRIRALRSKP